VEVVGGCRIGLGEDEGQPLVNGPGQLLSQVPLYVPALVQDAPLYLSRLSEHLFDTRCQRLVPSMTHSTPEWVSRPRLTRSANRAVTTVLFSVSPSHSPSGTLVPSVVKTRYTTTHEPATSSSSIMSTATSMSAKLRAISSLIALVVAATNHVDVAPGGYPGQHAFDDQGVEQVGRTEGLPRVEFDLGAAGGTAPRAFGLDLKPAENDRTLGVAVPVSDRLWGADLGVLLADRLGQLGRHHLVHHDEPGGRGECQQSVVDRPGHFDQGDCRLKRQVSQSGCLFRVRDAHNSYLPLQWWSPFWVVLWIGLLNTYLTAGLRRGTTTSLQQTWGHRRFQRRHIRNLQ
jgi:hypothetical protein